MLRHMPSFYNGKRFFLTYPQTDKLPAELVAFLQLKADVKSYLVAAEKHADGSPHLHACVEFKTVQRHAVDWLDFDGHHPNKQDPRNWAACQTYCKKDGDYISGPDEVDNKVDVQEACRNFEKEEDWMAYCIEKRIPYAYACFFWTRIHSDACTLTSNDHPGTMCTALAEFNFLPDVHRILIIKGPSGTGKTTWAKRNLPCPILFVSHIDKLAEFRSGYHKSIIFDDVDLNHWPRTSQIHVVDFENPRQIHCRYKCAQIPAGIVKCFTCNEWPLGEWEEISRRVRRFTIHK